MEDIEDLSGRDTLLSFVSMGRVAVQDEDPTVRLVAVRTLWDYEEASLIPIFLDLMEEDSDIDVRAAAAGALGQYVYAGEVDSIPKTTLKHIEDALLRVTTGEDSPAVRRSALESLGYSSRPEVTQLIERAYTSGDKDWLSSALFAMGRSANPDWAPKVLEMLEHNLPQVRSEAARAAAIHDTILTFPNGYDTLVGEKGVTLSGGQKQRVAIARTLLKDPAILILDDSTSSVDTETEAEIRGALDRLMVGRTTFVIAHRIQSVMNADLILVLDQGRIVQRGKHQELMAQEGIYRRIYDMQARIETELEQELAGAETA